MISLILPYWNRQEAADKALDFLADTYPDLDLEVVIVDDGSPVAFEMKPRALRMACLHLPKKSGPLSPVTCWNAGVEVSTGDIVVISCIEVLHTKPVLEQMAAELEKQGPDGYVLAAAYCPDANEWHCHTFYRSRLAPEMPTGFGRAFCGMMHRDLYERAGGFDEEYREGAGYEDIDFAYRMQRAGAKPVIRDDLIVIHPKQGATVMWGGDQFERNRALLAEKWQC